METIPGINVMDSVFSFHWKSRVLLTAEMSVMKKILVPVDFSEHSGYALDVASQIARKHEAGIVILHMLGLSESVMAKSEMEERQEAKYYLDLTKDKILDFTSRESLKDIPLEAIIQNYKDFSEVNHVAAEQNCDLIVIGSHGTSGLSEIFAGSNAEKVVRTSSIPVLVIKKAHENFQIKKMVFACDLKLENIPAYQKVAEFAKLFSASVEIVYVNTSGANYMGFSDVERKIRDFNEGLGEKALIRIYNYHSVEKGIFNFCLEHGADLLAIPTHGKRGIAHFFKGSKAEDVANHAKLPVLTIKL